MPAGHSQRTQRRVPTRTPGAACPSPAWLDLGVRWLLATAAGASTGVLALVVGLLLGWSGGTPAASVQALTAIQRPASPGDPLRDRAGLDRVDRGAPSRRNLPDPATPRWGIDDGGASTPHLTGGAVAPAAHTPGSGRLTLGIALAWAGTWTVPAPSMRLGSHGGARAPCKA